ncbi:MAG: NAD kinase [Alphaproteobacteria bacterium]
MISLKIHFFADKTARAQQALKELHRFHKPVPIEDADYWVVLGGDGFLLRHLHIGLNHNSVKIFGINCGTLGFLMNEFNLKKLEERLLKATVIKLNPLVMEAIDTDDVSHVYHAINEVSMLRHSSQAAHLKISVDSKVQLRRLICDGVLVATPAGSTAYNYSAHGPIIPLRANVLAMTPLSPFRPRRWRGALLEQSACVEVYILDPKKRPVSAVADFNEVKNVKKVTIQQSKEKSLSLLFDQESSLDARILKEQFGE